MDHSRRELLRIFTQPEEYLFEVVRRDNEQPQCYYLKAGESAIFRSEHSVSLFVEQQNVNSHPINLAISISEESRQGYHATVAELIRHRSPLLTQCEIVTLRCRKRVGRPLPTIAEAVVQHLPQGELLSVDIDGASASAIGAIYVAINNLEHYLRLSKIGFKSLRAEDVIIGDDGRLYPFRYEGLRFGCERDPHAPIAECCELREQVERVSGHAPTEVYGECDEEPYSQSLCDIYGGYINCREEHEGLIAVEAISGWGFIDSMGQLVIDTKFLSVGDFDQGRAVVQHRQSEYYGLIDRQGNYILRPIFRSVESLQERIYTIK